MNKQAYFKMMKMAQFNKAAQANVAGPLLMAILGGWGGNKLANKFHDDPGFFTKLLYILAGAGAGAWGGNVGQNLIQGTDNGAFIDGGVWNAIGKLLERQPATKVKNNIAPDTTQVNQSPISASNLEQKRDREAVDTGIKNGLSPDQAEQQAAMNKEMPAWYNQ